MAVSEKADPRPTVGIDLGTTNTVAAQRGRVLDVSPGAGVKTLLPSALAFVPTGERLVGWPARARRTIDPRHTLLSTKRLIGAAFTSYRAKRFAERHPYAIVEGREGRAAIRTRGGDLDPIDVAAALLREACPAGARAVITVPAAFEAEERAATEEAARAAGIEGARLIEEPVATAIAYLARSSLRYAAIYDLGGGTFDVAIVDCSRFPFQVASHAGDGYLGGDDVDRAIALRVAERVLREQRWDLEGDPETFARLIAGCEDAKLALSSRESVELALHDIDAASPAGVGGLAVTREELADITQGVVRRTFASCDHALAEAKLTASKIDAVFLAGGSTMLPGLSQLVLGYFGKRPRTDIDPMHVVAIGASTAATRPELDALLEDTP